MPSWEGKIYKLVSTYNYDGFMRKVGISPEVIEFGKKLTLTLQLIVRGDQYELLLTYPDFTVTTTFKPNEEFIIYEDNEKVRIVFIFLSPEKLLITHKESNGQELFVKMHFGPSLLKTFSRFGDESLVRVFEAEN